MNKETIFIGPIIGHAADYAKARTHLYKEALNTSGSKIAAAMQCRMSVVNVDRYGRTQNVQHHIVNQVFTDAADYIFLHCGQKETTLRSI